MVMVNESRERESEKLGVPEICGWFFDVARRGFGRRCYSGKIPQTFATRSIYEPLAISPYKMETEPSALDHMVLDTPLVSLTSSLGRPNTSSDKSETLRVPVLVCGTPRRSVRDRIRDRMVMEV